jgi:hypothetical protein
MTFVEPSWAYDASADPAPTWIPVSERLPPVDPKVPDVSVTVLLFWQCRDDSACYVGAYDFSDRGWMVFPYCQDEHDDMPHITHWMPLPDPPPSATANSPE